MCARLPALLSRGPRDAPSGGLVMNKGCYGSPLACTEGSPLLPGLSQERSHNGNLKAEAIPLSAKKKKGVDLRFLGETLRDS